MILTIFLICPNSIFAKENSTASNNKINPDKTWVFIVGVLEWQDSESFGSFPKENRRDVALVNYFKSIGVPASQIIYLQDNAATNSNIQSSITRMLKQTKPEDFLFLYYCGHGYESKGETFFASYDASQKAGGWKVSSIFNSIEQKFNGDKVFLSADCCYSGSLVKAIENSKSKISYASLTSSGFNQESTGNWTFTDCLLDAFSGEISTDLNDDGQISLEELANYTKIDMLFGEHQHAQFITTGNFSPDLVLSSAGKKTDPRIGRYVKVTAARQSYPARVVGLSKSKVKVHYLGYDKSDDEWVSFSQVRFITLPSTAVNKNLTYKVGEKVLVNWKGSWYKAVIKKANNSTYFVHYLGYGNEWDEWVEPSRVSQYF